MSDASESDLYDVIVIGGGPIGLFAVYYAGFRDLKVKLLEATEALGGQVSLLYPDKYIYDMPGFKSVNGKEMISNLVAQATQFNPTVCLAERVLHIEKVSQQQFEIITDRGKHVGKSLIIATGIGAFSPNKVIVPGVNELEGKGLYYYVKEPLDFKDKRVVIIGGGDTAVDWALHLKDIASKIYLVHRRDIFRAHEKSVEALNSSDIVQKLWCEMTEVKGDGGVQQVVLRNSQTNEVETIDCDALLVLIGYKADLSIVKQWGIAMDPKGISVDSNYETSVPGIYAAGDVASPKDTLKQNLLVVGFAQATTCVNRIKKVLSPGSAVFEHSTLKEPSQAPVSDPAR
ncbi:MAG TPA: NAD(P)/FAD-dependent oxidoreductase [Conexivisphaerales archaeon]|nr:NAD(P)/FAD-dependent oxidoreductase [Conexivisphaerales archaeon]